MENKKPMGLYIHIPFCNRKCDYCDFVSYSMDKKAQQKYLEAMFKEIDMVKQNFEDEIFDTIYIGGGTPSIVYEGFIASLARKVFSSFHFAEKTEFTIEVNPASFTKEKFIEYVQAGMNRISVGVQCLDSKLLAEHGRIQSIENVEETFQILRKHGFDNVSSDVMLGLPNQTIESVEETLEFLIQNRVKHISTYTLQVEKHTMLYDKIKRKKLKILKDTKLLEIYNRVNEILTEFDYIQYEISNYAKAGYKSRHNQKYWHDVDYLGLGVSAHSFVDGYRFYNTKRLDTYIDNLNQGKTAMYSKEYVPDEDRRVERLMLSLRTAEGLDLEKFSLDFKENLLLSRAEQIKKMQADGQIEIVDGFLRITPDNYFISNSIIVELM